MAGRAIVQKVYHLSPMQEGMLFHSLLHNESSPYYEVMSFRVIGELNVDLLQQAFDQLIARHDIFRTNFMAAKSKRPQQVVLETRKLRLHVEDLTHLDETSRAACIAQYKAQDKARSFDLAKQMLMRAAIFRLDAEKFQVVWSYHHILMDGWCLGIVFRELFEMYAALHKGTGIQLERPTPYAEFIQWLEKQDKQAAQQYWQTYLEGYHQTASFPKRRQEHGAHEQHEQHDQRDYQNSDGRNEKSAKSAKAFLHAEAAFWLDRDLTSQLVELAVQQQVTLSTVFHAVWAILLQRYNHCRDVVFGSVVSGRPPSIAGIEKMVGLFINTIPVRITSDELTFDQLLLSCKQSALDSEAHSYYPLYDIQAHSSLKQALFDHIVVFENYPLSDEASSLLSSYELGFVVDKLDTVEQTNYSLTVAVLPGEKLGIKMIYDAHQYEAHTIQQIVEHLQEVISKVVSNPVIAVHELEIVTEQERAKLLVEWNQTRSEYPREVTVTELFEQQVAARPERTALVYEQETLSYGELDKRVSQLARVLARRGVESGALVGLMAERSVEIVVSMLAILKLGAAYVPIDPEYPVERIRYMLQDSGTSLLVTQRHLAEKAEQTGFAGELFMVEAAGLGDVGEDIAGSDAEAGTANTVSDASVGSTAVDVSTANVASSVHSASLFNPVEAGKSGEQLAYVMYTSGTTGEPKGVLITHRGIVKLAKEGDVIDVTPQDVMLSLSSFAFDGSTFDVYSALLNGATLVIASKPTMLDVSGLTRVMEEQGVTVFLATTALFNVLVDARIEALCGVRKLFFGGEKASLEHVRRALEQLGTGKLVNAYGPTENTVIATCQRVDRIAEDASVIPIGRPIRNTTAYVLSPYGQLQPIGVAGELCVGGEGLALGYWQRPELTAERFMAHPFEVGEKLYRTGDLVRWLPDGTLEYVGRLDNQVKLRGQRIELGEIEAVLKQHPDVQDAVVLVWNRAGQLPDPSLGHAEDREEGCAEGCEEGRTEGRAEGPVEGRMKGRTEDRADGRMEGSTEGCAESHTEAPAEGQGGLLPSEGESEVGAGRSGDAYLCAYVVTRPNDSSQGEVLAVLRAFARSKLPSYMVPAFFVNLEQLPLTANGKVDRRALAEPDLEQAGAIMGISMYAVPATELEVALAELWQQVLGIERVGVWDNFFERGGHSLKAMLLIAQCEKVLGVEVPLRLLFERPTIRELAEQLVLMQTKEHAEVLEPFDTPDSSDPADSSRQRSAERKLTEIESLAKQPYYSVSSAQKRIFVLQQLDVSTTSYNVPGVYRLEGQLDTHRLQRALQKLVDRHESFRTSYTIVNEEPVQVIHDEVLLDIMYTEIGQFEGQERHHSQPNHAIQTDRQTDRQIEDHIQAHIESFIRPFSLEQAPLMRVEVLKLATNEHLLLLDIHHIAADGLSFSIIWQELVQLYTFDQLDAFWPDEAGPDAARFDSSQPDDVRLDAANPSACEIAQAGEQIDTCRAEISVVNNDEAHKGDAHNDEAHKGDATNTTNTTNVTNVTNATNATSMAKRKALPELRIQYKEYAAWQQQWLQSESMQRQEAYWLHVFQEEGDIPTLELPTDYPRPAIRRSEGDSLLFTLTREQTQGLQQLARDTGSTLYMLLLAAYNVLLHKYTNQTDIVVGSPIAGRSQADLADVVGMFVNTLALRSRPEGSKSFIDLLNEVKQQTLQAFAHQDYPFELLVEKLELTRDMSRNPLFDTMFTLQSFGDANMNMGDITWSNYPVQARSVKFDLVLTIVATEERLECNFEYSTSLFAKESMERFVRHFSQIVQGITAAPHKLIQDIAVCSLSEQRQLLVDWNKTWSSYPREQSLHALFEQQVVRTPNQTAIIFEHVQLTYSELNNQANKLAHALRSKGIHSRNTVGLLLERSHLVVVSILAILKTGGAYVPIDPEYPAERMGYILHDCQADLLLTEQHLHDKAAQSGYNGAALYVDGMDWQEKARPNATLSGDSRDKSKLIESDELAYIIYTSGTTGKPKGTLTTHRNISRVVMNTNYIQVTEKDVVLGLSSFAFDGSTFDIFGALLNGATLVIASKQDVLDISKLVSIIERQHVTVLFITTALFNLIVDLRLSSLRGLRKILFGGERVSVHHVEKAYQALGAGKLIHVYGPTESTVFTTYFPIDDWKQWSTIPIGRPLSNTTVYILGSHNQLQPLGVAGELCIGGEGVAQGYLHRPELTREKFTAHPFQKGKTIYRTGDMARWLPNGTIEYIGRIDDQVKIRGHRIELGEIETVLRSHPVIRDAFVTEWTDQQGDKHICAYVVSRKDGLDRVGEKDKKDKEDNDGEGGKGDVDSMGDMNDIGDMDNMNDMAQIKAYLSQQLPSYMIPTFLIPVSVLPLTLNGKVNLGKLPQPSGEWLRELGQACYAMPVTESELYLLELWQDILGVESIRTDDNFFVIGGNSLKALALAAKISDQFKIELPTTALFEHSTIKSLATYLDHAGGHSGEVQSVFKLNQQAERAVFCFPPVIGNGFIFYELAQGLHAHTLYGFEFLANDLRLEQYLAHILNIQPDGPYVLLGYSAGGNLAFEVAQKLEELGHEVSDIIIMDAAAKSDALALTDAERAAKLEEMFQYFFEHELYKDYLTHERVRRSVMRSTSSYLSYWSSLQHSGQVNANIHMVRHQVQDCNEQEMDVHKAEWASFTTAQYCEYAGFGKHDEMLFGGYVGRNRELIKEILERIESRSALVTVSDEHLIKIE
ncbi:amino acid adenylation domain-containing protein [Paenibacillus sp. 481]|nr:non-ribosomal peptide synthetase [Paenibacillus sp. 481]UHA72101.1 amino acid adenylation domain-containing protein [Paenibacillus sp. 481]